MLGSIKQFSSASDLRNRQNSLFSNQFSDCSFVFEFIAMNAKATFKSEPVFQAVDNINGFDAVDAVGLLNVSANNFSKLFYFKTDDLDTLTVTTPLTYGVLGNASLNVEGVNPFSTFADTLTYSNSQIYSGFANPAIDLISNTLLYQDYIRYTAKSITGGYALSDIFSNELELLTAVGSMDPSFNQDLAGKLNNASYSESPSSNIIDSPLLGENYWHLISCKTLVDNLLKIASSADTNNISSYIRGQQFLRDLRKQSIANENTSVSDNVSFTGLSSNTYWVIFQPGDVMAVRLNYTPKNGSGAVAMSGGAFLGGNKIYDRSYKIYLKMT
jgi:hypothetical protein